MEVNQALASASVGRAEVEAQVVKMLAGKDSPHTRRAYQRNIMEFYDFTADSDMSISRETLTAYKAYLRDDLQCGTSAINQRLSAVKFFVRELAIAGTIKRKVAKQICRVENVKTRGQRSGAWLSNDEATELLTRPAKDTALALRDRAALALLIGAGLRRSEAASLTVEHFEKRAGRWAIVNLVGKGGTMRTIPINARFKRYVDKWCERAGITTGLILRRCSWAEGKFRVSDQGVSEQAIYRLVRRYSGVAPHDLRRTFAKLADEAGISLHQTQLNLGHRNVGTTELYVKQELDFKRAPSDVILRNLPDAE